MVQASSVEISRVDKFYGPFQALKNVSMTVPPGKVTCLIGPSGSGKSTLLRCINFLEEYDSGEIRIDGQMIGYDAPGRKMPSRKLREMRRSIGMVFQQFHLFPHLTALDNITLAPRVVRRATREAAEERALALLAKVGLRDRAGAYPHELSGGQQQRVAIARALAQAPEVLLFDEPTSALDPEMRDDVMEVIRELATTGITMLVVTHEMQFAHDIASRVWVIDHGRIVEDGPPAQVVDAPQTEVAREFFARIRR